MIYSEEMQRIGDAIGLQGKFLVNWGTQNIIDAFNEQKSLIAKAQEILKLYYEYGDISAISTRIREEVEDVIDSLEASKWK
jgi:hypothetical protein